jgi:hypothetical protein
MMVTETNQAHSSLRHKSLERWRGSLLIGGIE